MRRTPTILYDNPHIIQCCFKVDVLPVGLYSILNPAPSEYWSEWKWIKISLLEETWLGGIESPQYFPIMGDVLEAPS